MELPAAAPTLAPAMPAEAYAQGDAGVVPQTTAPDVTDPRKIVYRANISLAVKDVAAAARDVEALALRSGGYVAQSQLSQYTGDQLRGTVVIRVPAEGYRSALEELRRLAVRVLYESSTAEDVTAEYTDLEARLRNLEAVERELQAMLTEVRQQPGAKAEDILAVYRELAAKQEEIERVKGRMQYLSNLAALSTITVDLVPDEATRPVVEEEWRPAVTVRNAVRTLTQMLQGFADLIINLVIVGLPLLLMMALPVVLVIWVLRRLLTRKKTS
ncbi:MAG: DUF4349 domain-containing protein [Caldilineales bacterium]|nr:DUF4349 domain-containing protein [Caldilineales bacterium]